MVIPGCTRALFVKSILCPVGGNYSLRTYTPSAQHPFAYQPLGLRCSQIAFRRLSIFWSRSHIRSSWLVLSVVWRGNPRHIIPHLQVKHPTPTPSGGSTGKAKGAYFILEGQGSSSSTSSRNSFRNLLSSVILTSSARPPRRRKKV